MKFEDDLNDKEVQGQWRRLQAAIEKKQAAGEQPVRAIRPGWKSSWKADWKRSAGIAASLALLLAVSVWLIREPSSRVRYSTGYGEQKHITLPDSSEVVLNANSSLSFSSDWQTGAPRTVELRGEAFFSVVHTKNNQRFIVNTPEGMEVEVLGTEFNVYDRRGIQRVVLNSGSVRLEYKDKEVLSMEPGDMVTRQGEAGRPEKRKVDPSRYSSWTSGRLVFENKPVKEVCRLLEDNFGLTVSLPDTLLGNRLFNGTFPVDNAEVLLKALMTTYNLDAAKNGSILQLRRKPAPPGNQGR